MIDVYSTMHNEETIVPYWLRHYTTFADRIFVWEDESTDATRELLSQNPKVTLLPVDQHGHNDMYYVRTLFPQYEALSRGVADWVIVVDADEFIYHPNLLEVLAQAKEQGVQLIRCQGYAMVSDKLPTTAGQIYDEIKLGLPDQMETKWVIHSPELRIRYGGGRHARPQGGKTCVSSVDTGIKLLHYRYLGEQYFEGRDRLNTERCTVGDRIPRTYSRKTRHFCPDGHRESVIEWYARNKHLAIDVVS